MTADVHGEMPVAQPNGSSPTTIEGFNLETCYPRSILVQGNTARLQHVLDRARRGEKVVIATIGGSITEGASAPNPESRYANRVAQWWHDQFPQTMVEFVNAGIGATGSNYGAFRVQSQLLDKKPDFVVVDYAVNDYLGDQYADSYEGLLRQILKQPNQPAVMAIAMMSSGGVNLQEQQLPICQHYSIPMLSFRDACWPEMQAGQIGWDSLMADIVHPNASGHLVIATLINHYLETVLKTLPATPDQLPAIDPLPAPLRTDAYEFTHLYPAETMVPLRNEGWVLGGNTIGRSWHSETPGSLFEVEVEGTIIHAMIYRLKGAMGKAHFQVDDQPPVIIDGWFDQSWGGYRNTEPIAENLSPGKHKVCIKLLEEKNPESTGYGFDFYGFGTAGR